MTVLTIFNAFIIAVFVMTAALISKRIQRTITEQAVKIIAVWLRMAREIFTVVIAKKSVTILHNYVNDLSVIS